jgi:hypothetical protein
VEAGAVDGVAMAVEHGGGGSSGRGGRRAPRGAWERKRAHGICGTREERQATGGERAAAPEKKTERDQSQEEKYHKTR